ncbi:MAG: lipid-binding SYLF domain-containing protein [Vicinamibacterales bacterium]
MNAVRSMVAAAVVVTLGSPLGARQTAQGATDEAQRLQNSTDVLRQLTSTPDDRIPQHLLARAEAIVVIPSLIKGGFVVGAKHGRGVLSAKNPATNVWSAPAFVNLTGGSIGWQIGIESVDLVMLVMNPTGIDPLLEDKFTIGGNLSLAAGPIGRSGDAAVNAQVNAPILAYSRSRGLFAGATFEGAALHADDNANKAFYGSPVSLRELVRGTGTRGAPGGGSTWMETLKRLTTSASPSDR